MKTVKKSQKSRRELNNLGVAVFLIAASILAVLFLWVNDALSEPVAEEAPAVQPSPERVGTAIKFLMQNVNPRDARVKRAEETGKLIFEESDYYGLDPFLVLSTVFCESSLKSGIQADSKYQEWGMAQVHGTARNLCFAEMRSRGIDPTSEHGQIGCSAFNLSYWENDCGFIARDLEQCQNYKQHCGGAVSAYISGSCQRAKKSKAVASKVSYRLRFARKLDRVTR